MRKLVLVMPVFNEADGLKATLLDLWTKLPGDIHLIIIDDNSKDGSREIAQEFSTENNFSMTIIQNQENKGHGPSIVRGLFTALEIINEESFILTLDGDGQIPSAE
jgi:glycosyltransferase involved in cell wall biosynthesis